jgi:hypothetical protein
LKRPLLSACLGTLLLMGPSSVALASGWINYDAAFSNALGLEGMLSGGGTVNQAETLALNGAFSYGFGEKISLGLSYTPTPTWVTSLQGSLNTIGGFSSSRGLVTVGLSHDLLSSQWSLTLSGGADRYSEDAGSNDIHLTVSKEAQSLTQLNGGLLLQAIFDRWLGVEGGVTAFGYDRDPSDPRNIFQLGPPIPYEDFFRGGIQDGLILLEWSGGLSLKLGHGATLSADGDRSESANSGVWTTSVRSGFEEDWSPRLSTLFSWNKAVSNGYDSPMFELSLTHKY